MTIDELPILGICGWSGSGKTTLIEAIVPALAAGGLKVAVVKHDAHGIDVDREGKDSDRFYRAGADVLLQGPAQEVLRAHRTRGATLDAALLELVARYDILLVEGHKGTPLRKMWILGEEESSPPADAANIAAVLDRNCDRPTIALEFVRRFIDEQWLKTPVLGCVLIGGRSKRMREPKHLLTRDGKTWLQRTAELLARWCKSVVIAGAGEVAGEPSSLARLADVPDAHGPVSGLLAAMRWAPRASWLVAACDLPDLSADALEWLLSTRAAGTWATIPRLAGSPGAEPLLAHYDFRARGLLEAHVAAGNFRPAAITKHSKVISPQVPAELAGAWRNVNSLADLRSSDYSG